MTIRDRLTLRFTALVSSILLLAFVSIYAFCWYFITADFYHRLERKAITAGDMIIRHRLDADLVQRLGRMRRDQLPKQKILVFDEEDSLLFSTQERYHRPVSAAVLASIRGSTRKSLRQEGYSLSGIRYATDEGPFVVVATAENSYGDAFLWWLFVSLTTLFVVITGITALAGRIFAGDALEPMQRIDQRLGQIFPARQDERLPVRAETDEISRLSATINQLLDRVAESFRMQRLFVANVSHELKNPLTQISSQLEVSLLNERDPERYRETIRSVLDDVNELASLTHELLRLSQVQRADRADLLTETVRLDDIVWDIRDEVSALNPRYQVRVELGELPDDPALLAVSGNRALLRTALKNLTENACKFAPDGRAHLRLDYTSAAVQLTLRNAGQPIPEEELPYIFEPFFRSRQAADQVRGYGVGLSLVERIVRLHGGQIGVQSGAETGTLFQVTLRR
jgi:two-component system heavy metal sensor histidine kinase CusS